MKPTTLLMVKQNGRPIHQTKADHRIVSEQRDRSPAGRRARAGTAWQTMLRGPHIAVSCS